jgi:hypothetical protein
MTRNTATRDALLDELLKDYTDPKAILGAHGSLQQLTKRVIERALEVELTTHLGYAPHDTTGVKPRITAMARARKRSKPRPCSSPLPCPATATAVSSPS